ncbi:MAG: HAD-IA family hydrolase [Bacteroidales bacterium]|nr:HAD-IA family hydrolase [Bacteroidales bacterium]
MPLTNKLKAVLFDMDGVLLDSEKYICQAGIEMFKEKGFNIVPNDFLPFTGMGENRYLGGVAEKYNIPFVVEKDKARTYEIYAGLVNGKLKPLDGVIEFIEKCLNKKLKIAVASSADLIKVKINLKEIGIPEKTFNTIVSGLDIKNKKPAPDIFLEAAKRVGTSAPYCLVIEDAISGVTAGKAAGAKVLALTTTFDSHDLKEADWITDNLSTANDEVLDW